MSTCIYMTTCIYITKMCIYYIYIYTAFIYMDMHVCIYAALAMYVGASVHITNGQGSISIPSITKPMSPAGSACTLFQCFETKNKAFSCLHLLIYFRIKFFMFSLLLPFLFYEKLVYICEIMLITREQRWPEAYGHRMASYLNIWIFVQK